jgi:tetratricopeptide (TPR) repeat protein
MRSGRCRLTKLQWLIALLLAVLVIGGVLHLPRGLAAYQEWRLSRLSVKQLEGIAKERDHDASAHYYLGAAYARANEYDLAVHEFLTVVNLQPSHAKAFNDLGVTYMAQGKQFEALLALRAATQADPSYAKAHANLGRLYLTAHSPYSAANALKQAVQLDPQDGLAFADLAVAHQETFNFQESLAAFQKAVQLEPRHAEIWSNMAETYRGLARYENAEKAVQRALQLNPKHPRALSVRGRLLFERAKSRQDWQQAEQFLEKAVAAEPESGGALYYLGCVRRKLGNEQEAAAVLEKAYALAPTDTGVMYQLGLAYVATGRKEKGQQLLKRFEVVAALMRERDVLEKRVDDEPDNLRVHLRLGQLYLFFQEPTATVRECSLVLKKQPDNAIAHRLLGFALRDLGRRAEAEQHLQRASALERGNGNVRK